MINPINLPTGDKRVGEFAGALTDFIYENAHGLPFPSIIGAIEIVKHELLEAQLD